MKSGDCEERSLETLERDLSIFHKKYNSSLKKAMLANNVIGELVFTIPLCQVCIPGLHLMLVFI